MRYYLVRCVYQIFTGLPSFFSVTFVAQYSLSLSPPLPYGIRKMGTRAGLVCALGKIRTGTRAGACAESLVF